MPGTHLYSTGYYEGVAGSEGARGARGIQGEVGPTGPAGSIDILTDVTITSAVENETLHFDGANWINGTNGAINDVPTSIAVGFLPAGTLTGTGNTIMGPEGIASSLTTGTNNVIIGESANVSATVASAVSIGDSANVTTNQGVAVGYSTLSSNTGVAVGVDCTSTGTSSMALGRFASATADYSISLGYLSTADGNNSIAIGYNCDAGEEGISIGYNSGSTVSGAIRNTAIGYQSLTGLTTLSADYNVGIGFQVLNQLETGYHNTSVGASNVCGLDTDNGVTIGMSNSVLSDFGVAIGTTCIANNGVAIGRTSNCGTNTSAICIGDGGSALANYAVSIGYSANADHVNGIALGYNVSTGADNEFCIPSTTATVSSGTTMVFASDGQVGPTSSTRRHKDNIRNLEPELFDRFIKEAQPRRFEWKVDGKSDCGMIAEELYEICPELVPLDNDGLPRSINYDRISVLLTGVVQQLLRRVEQLEHSK